MVVCILHHAYSNPIPNLMQELDLAFLLDILLVLRDISFLIFIQKTFISRHVLMSMFALYILIHFLLLKLPLLFHQFVFLFQSNLQSQIFLIYLHLFLPQIILILNIYLMVLLFLHLFFFKDPPESEELPPSYCRNFVVTPLSTPRQLF